jgi:hypothetical protein
MLRLPHKAAWFFMLGSSPDGSATVATNPTSWLASTQMVAGRFSVIVPSFHFLPGKLARSRCHARAKAFDQASAVLRRTLAMLQRYHNGRVPPRWIIGYVRDCAEQQLRKRGAAPVRWTRYALSYWRNLQALAPKVTAGGSAVLLRKLGPPYSSAGRRMRDPLSCLKIGPVAKMGEGTNGQVSARS